MGGDCVRNCKRVPVAVMESSTPAAAAATSQSKRLKLDFYFEEIKHKHSSPSSSHAASSAASSAASENSDRFLTGDAHSADSPPSFCSSNESTEVVKDNSSRLSDLESFEKESSRNNFSSREASPCSEVCVDDEMEETPPAETEKLTSQSPPPPREEIEEFFAEAERAERKRFEERYNYDVAKDAPLEGRYQWVEI